MRARHGDPTPRALIAIAILCLSACWRGAPAAIDLIDRYPEAEKRSSYELTQAFSVFDAAIAGASRRTILAHPPSRLTWTLPIPRNARLHAWVAIRPDVWDRAGDGVVFRVGVAAGDQYTMIGRVHVDPFNRPDDRRWIELDVSLQPYGGQTAKLILSTEVSPQSDRADARGDLALWGDPRVVVEGGPRR